MTVNPKDARAWTRDDLPSASSAWRSASKSGGIIPTEFFVSEVLDAVVARLNERGGAPAERHDLRDPWANLTAADRYLEAKRAENPAGWERASFGQKSGHITQRLRELGFAPTGATWPGEDAPNSPLNSTHVGSSGKCCEEAQLEAKRAERAESDLAHRNEELSEAEGEIAALTKRAEKVEAERDELQASIVELQPAENRTTMSQVEAENLVNGATCGKLSWDEVEEIAAALAPAVEGWPDGQSGSSDTEPISDWPDWLGPKVDPDECNADSRFVSGAYSANELREKVRYYVRLAGEAEASARAREAMNAEQAKANAEDESHEARLAQVIVNYFNVHDSAAHATAKAIVREAKDAGWTPPESEAGA